MKNSLGGLFFQRMHADFRNGVHFAIEVYEQRAKNNHFDTAKGDLMRTPHIKKFLLWDGNLDPVIVLSVNPDGFRNGKAPPLIW
jgi:hypothetical protein